MEYSEEENKAIEYIEECKQKNAGDIAEIFKSSCVLKELVEKQQKEIENLKDKNKDLLRKLKNRVKEVKKLIKYSQYKKEFSRLNKLLKEKQKSIENSISKKEIREKIEELYLEMSRYEDIQAQGSVAYMQTYHAKNVLEELLGE